MNISREELRLGVDLHFQPGNVAHKIADVFGKDNLIP